MIDKIVINKEYLFLNVVVYKKKKIESLIFDYYISFINEKFILNIVTHWNF